jgi:thioredoxin:protein disulfide reductase
MICNRILTICLLLAAPVAAMGQGVVIPDWGATAKEPKPEVSVSVKSVPSGQAFEVIADFELDDTVKLYRDKLFFTWSRLKGARVLETIMPTAKVVPDRGAGNPDKKVPVYEKSVRIIVRLMATGRAGDGIEVDGNLAHQSCTDQTCFRPATEPFRFRLSTTAAIGPPVASTQPAAVTTRPAVSFDGQRRDINLWWELIVAFLWGIGIGFTPCVYPMIPVTAAIIGAKKERGLAPALVASITYVLGMALIYAIIGMVVSKFGAEASAVLHAWYVIVPIAAIFVALAITLLAGWNLSAPTGAMAKLQQMLAGRKGLFSIFALGAVGGLVAGPCVLAPLFGKLQQVFALGDPLVGFLALFVVALGMGVPLIVFSTGTGLLPKAGPWMEWVKNLMAFVLLWAALYFLIPIIGDAVYSLAFAVLLVVGAVFLGGLDSLSKDSVFGDRAKRALGMVAVLAAVVMAVYVIGVQKDDAENLFKPGSTADVQAALDAGQPFIIDFYADWCVICKELDRTVFTKSDVVAAGGKFKTIKIDTDKYPDVAAMYNVKAPPVVVFINADGTVNLDLSFPGSVTDDEFLAKLKKFGR